MKRTLTAVLASLVLMTGLSAAQAVSLQGRLHRTVSPTNGTYNLTTGFELGAPTFRSGPATIFDNTDGVNYYFSTLPPTEEWIDSFAFVADEISGFEQINGFEFQYCSMFPDPQGNMVTAEIRFYEDDPGFMEPTGWTDLIAGTVQNSACAYILPGLPGDISGTGTTCWFMNINLACGFECSVPQEITPGGVTEFNGVGWMMRDPSGGFNTGPILGSNIHRTFWGYGSRDLFTIMDLADVGAEFQGTFFWGINPKTLIQFNIILYGDGIPDTDVINPDTPNTGDVLCLGSDMEFRNGNAVTWALDDLGGTAVFPSAAYAMLVGTSGSSAGFGSIAGPGTTLLVDPGSLVTPPTPLVMGGIVPSVTTPSLPGLPPTIWAQAMGFNGGIGPGNAAEASNALRHNN
ncbi:MAG: hypothetical protein COA70_11930 [Planctomycetota bacterium]|nr:MAG: hypothetical protein COA70_11930 [Planctomycetota bacterium]